MTTQHRRIHAVVGDGVTALAFVQNTKLSSGSELKVIGGRASQFGRGVAYAVEEADAPWRYAYLLNSPADDIDPSFAQWLMENWAYVADKMRNRAPDWLSVAQPLRAAGDTFGVNAPREFYGDFIEEQAEAAFAALRANGVEVTIIDAQAVSIDDSGEAFAIKTDAGAIIEAHSVDIAPGGPSTQRFPGDDGPYSAPQLFGHEARILDHIRSGAEIFCIGANATMLDALRLCQCVLPEDALRFVACSPRGELPPPLIPRLPRMLTKLTLTPGRPSAQSFLDEVRREIEAARARGEEMREIRAGFRQHFLDHGLSKYIASQAEARKIPGRLRHWLRGGSRDSICDFHRLMARGKTSVEIGAVVAVEALADGAKVILRDRSGQMFERRTGFVINCAGPGAKSSFDQLTQDMLAKGWLTRCAVTGGLEVGESCAAGGRPIRHLSPATTVIGGEVMPMPLYDAHLLRSWVKRADDVYDR